MKKFLLNFIFIILFSTSESFALDYKIGSKVSGLFEATKKLKIELPPGKWEVVERHAWEFYGLRAFSYGLARVEKGKVVESIGLTELHTAGVYEGHLNVEIIKIFFKNKYDGCYERPEYFYLNLELQGSAFLKERKIPDLKYYEVSKDVNKPTNNSISLIQPTR